MSKILDNIDDFLNQQKESEAKVFFFLPVLIFGFLSYYFLYPITDQNLTNAKNQNQNLISKINTTKMTINSFRINNKKLIKDIKGIEKEIVVLKQEKEKFESLIKDLGFLKFNLVEWSNFYHKIPDLASANRLTIMKLDNIMDLTGDSEQLVQKKMTITVVLAGDFIRLVKFIYAFEKKKELIKVRKIDLSIGSMTVTFDIYGAKL
jgi:hypothetical protein